MHEEWDENYNRGYEWWLMKEAKKQYGKCIREPFAMFLNFDLNCTRNPNIKLLGLSWAWPNWLGSKNNDPYIDLEKTAMYTVKWILGAKLVHNLTIDFIGIWNERPCNFDYIIALKRALIYSKLDDVKIIGCDGWWDMFGSLSKNKTVTDTLYAFGVHYPGATSPKDAIDSNMTLWASEDYSTFNDDIGAGCWARILNQNYVGGYMTSTIAWNLIASYYPGLPYEKDGLMTAVEPWSGHYEINNPIWITAHTTQFTEIGWKYLQHGHGVGRLDKGGSYVALASPDRQQLTIVIETMAKLQKLQVWKSQLKYNGDNSSTFIPNGTIQIRNGRIFLDLDVDTIITLTTVSDGNRGDAGPVPKSSLFPLPYEETFQNYSLNQEPDNLAPQIGTWEILQDVNTSTKFARQMVAKQPVAWCDIQPYPLAIIGDQSFTDLNLTARVRLPDENATESIFLGIKTQIAPDCSYYKSRGIFLHLHHLSSSYTVTLDMVGLDIVDIGPLSEPFNVNKWYTVSLSMKREKVIKISNVAKIALTCFHSIGKDRCSNPMRPPRSFLLDFAGAVLDANPTATDILSVEAPRPTEIDADINAITSAMLKEPINQPTLSDPVLLAADYTQPPVEAIALATQEEIKPAQAPNPTITKIIEPLQNGNVAKHPIVFFIGDVILHPKIRDQCQLVIPASMVDQTLDQFHRAKILNHQGSNHTLVAIKAHFWWPHMEEAIHA
uniref:galactosylceramidase n=1 Tax=Romanomermis culicivorax TaxID=13658 RepID=A0A915JEG5_ROMCU